LKLQFRLLLVGDHRERNIGEKRVKDKPKLNGRLRRVVFTTKSHKNRKRGDLSGSLFLERREE